MILLSNYTYDLPPEKIAHHPLPNRDQSRLLVFHQGRITHSNFNELKGFLPKNTLLFFNDTKVIPARLRFQKETGADIELFLLSPVSPSTVLQSAMEAKGAVRWKCAIGNLKRWKPGTPLKLLSGTTTLHANLVDRDEGIVEFAAHPEAPFAEIIQRFGVTPLPPYIKRDAEPADANRYQTVYSIASGAVAAPTAGLHFTPTLLEQLRMSGIRTDFLTLHVGAGTFQPIKVSDASQHVMHAEQIVITERNLRNLLAEDQYTIAVGTTSLRTLESLYWFGARLWQHPDDEKGFIIHQSDPYDWAGPLPSRKEALEAIVTWMSRNNTVSLMGETSIFILPGYKFKMCNGLITNFHQPGSTLLLLISAFVGEHWKTIYQEALNRDYRFLSYGDSSLLLQ